jgi:hypothetical protein
VRQACKAPRQGKRLYLRILFPQVHDLQKRFSIRVALFHLPFFCVVFICRFVNYRPVSLHLVPAYNLWKQNVAILPEAADLRFIQGIGIA